MKNAWKIAIGLSLLLTACDDEEHADLQGGGPGSSDRPEIVTSGETISENGTTQTTNASLFGSVDDPSRGGSGDPNTSGNWYTGAWGKNIGDPSAQGVSLPPSVEAAAFGGNADNANGQLVQVTNLSTGQTAEFPIVDKGPGARSVANGYGLDMLPASAAQIGVTSGSRVQYTIVPLNNQSFK